MLLTCIYTFWFNKLEFKFFIVEDCEKEGAFLLSPSHKLTGSHVSQCVSYSTVNQFPFGSLGRNKRSSVPIQTYSKYPLKVSPETAPCRDERRENARAAIWSTGFVWQAERIWAILQPLAQNNNPMLRNLMWLSCSPVGPPTQNLNT